MERIINNTHSSENILYALSRALERASYYGIRSLVVLYMIGGVLQMENVEALEIYRWFTASFLFSKIIGAILGDLVVGNKKAIILGGILQALGAFSFCIPSLTGLYIGLFLVVLGAGLYSPNIISNFGKLYLNKTKLLDAGFTMLYLAVNLGAFFGVMIIGYFGDLYGWNIGFIMAGVIMLLSLLPVLFSKDNKINHTTKKTPALDQRVISIIIAIVTVSLFWTIYEIVDIRIYDIQSKLSEISNLNIPKSLWTSLSSIFTLPVSILAIIAWTFFYNNQFFKLTIGIILGAISFGILFLIPEIPTEQHTIVYVASLLLLSISEIHIGPVVYSIITKNSNPKYLAILISLASIPTKLFSMIFSFFSERFYEDPIFSLRFGLVAMIVLSIGLIIFVILMKKNK